MITLLIFLDPPGLSVQSIVEGVLVVAFLAYISGKRILSEHRDSLKLKAKEEQEAIEENTASSDRIARNWRAECEVAQAAYSRLQQQSKDELSVKEREIQELKTRIIFKDEQIKDYERKTADMSDQHLVLVGKMDMIVRQFENFMKSSNTK